MPTCQASIGVGQALYGILLLYPQQLYYYYVDATLGILGYKDGSVGSAVVAVVLVHCVIAAFVYTAWVEGSHTTFKGPPLKKD